MGDNAYAKILLEKFDGCQLNARKYTYDIDYQVQDQCQKHPHEPTFNCSQCQYFKMKSENKFQKLSDEKFQPGTDEFDVLLKLRNQVMQD